MKKNILYRILVFSITVSTAVTPLSGMSSEKQQIRVATFNIASGLSKAGELDEKLSLQDDPRLLKVAAIIQKVRPDIILLNEFDFNAEIAQAELLQNNYLAISQSKQKPITYPYSYSGAVNTGVDSGLDLDNNDKKNDPADAWGFGRYPGQYGMLVLSRYPIDKDQIRSFQKLRWASMPGALRSVDPDTGKPWYSESTWQALRLSSKSHWDIPIKIAEQTLHFLVMHPTPPVFDGPEDRNGRRNHDEIRLFADYIDPEKSGWIVDDQGNKGGLATNSLFIIAGDMNADPLDGDSTKQAINQLIQHKTINNCCAPTSDGAVIDSQNEAGKNLSHTGNPATDTGKFNPKYLGNLRLDYVFPSAQIKVQDCGVFWPVADSVGSDWIDTSDHRLVWLDIDL